MLASVNTIPLANLALAVLPVLFVVFINYKWSLNYKNSLMAVARMLFQLLLIGYLLAYIFSSEGPWLILFCLTVMLLASSIIAIKAIKNTATEKQIPAENLKNLFWFALISIVIGGVSVLVLVTQFVLNIEPWYQPKSMIPLAGMIFSNSMNSVSLAAERLFSEIGREGSYAKARNIAYNASLIPITNSLFAVGLVSLPGMMTGQILSGISPLIAARYQIMVMCMIFASSGISSACFLKLLERSSSSIKR